MERLIVIAVIAAIAGALFWLIAKGRQQQKKADFERRVQSRKLGWSYVGERDGRIDYRFNGNTADVAWSMWYDSDRGDDSPTPKSIWKTSNLRTPGLALVILGSKRYQLESGTVGRVLLGVVSGVAQAMTGSEAQSDKAEFYESAIALEEGRAAFRELFTVAIAPDMPCGWLDEELQSLLIRWPSATGGSKYEPANLLEVTLRSDGLQIVAQKMPQEFVHWRHLARLGETLAQRLVAHTAPANAEA